ncbi:carotenoid oxygenase family protein [Streptomyces zaomyceticus]|uniref:carotenoid oxygenase family protein n=1 Tax=Streptomyces zaomyceticus TaxID=68286 RepID=UPI003866500B
MLKEMLDIAERGITEYVVEGIHCDGGDAPQPARVSFRLRGLRRNTIHERRSRTRDPPLGPARRKRRALPTATAPAQTPRWSWTTCIGAAYPSAARRAGAGTGVSGSLARAAHRPRGEHQDTHLLDGAGVEFPRIDDRPNGRRHRHTALATSTCRTDLLPAADGEYDAVRFHDVRAGPLSSGTPETCRSANRPAFAPEPGTGSEERGSRSPASTASRA